MSTCIQNVEVKYLSSHDLLKIKEYSSLIGYEYFCPELMNQIFHRQKVSAEC